jgi:tetratricopeptide (TPR) repeat protein
MAGKKLKTKKTKTKQVSYSVNFLFYGKGSEIQYNLLSDSIKQFRKDLSPETDFYVENPSDQNLVAEGAAIIELKETVMPSSLKNADYLIAIPIAAIENRINFNSFFNNEEFDAAGNEKINRIFSKNQKLNNPSCLIIGKDVQNYLKTLPSHGNLGLREQLNFYGDQLNAWGKDLYLDHSPFLKPLSFKKLRWPLWTRLKRSLSWNFQLPFMEQRSNSGFTAVNEKPIWRFIFSISALLIFFLLPILSFNAGISGDEEKHHLHAEKVYNYYKTDGADTLALNDPKYKLNYYGQSFDLFAFLFVKTFNIEKVYETRHVLNGITGALAIITTGILVRYFAGSFAGFIAMLFMFFFPRFMGHAMNNPLDIPFAMGYIFSIYQMIRFLRKLPEFSIKHAILLALGIGFTTSIRIGGLILIPYLFMFSGLYLVFKRWPWKFLSGSYLKFAGKGLIYISLISICAYSLSILPWPYALQDPINNPFKALGMMSNITVALRVMFEGKVIWSDTLPWYYVPKNMWITIPVVIWIFFFVPLILFFRKNKNIHSFWLFTLYFITIFPVLYIIYKESNVYGGWRHSLFIYPGFAALAAIGVNSLKNISGSRIYRVIFTGILILALIHPIAHTFRNYPLQYIYFNEIAGGVNNAYKKYETDYYLNSLKPGTDWIKQNIVKEGEDKITIVSNAPFDIMQYYYRDHLDQISFPYTRYYDRGSQDWDYAIFYCNYIDPYQLRRDLWPPKNTIHEVKVDDVTVCAIVKRENKSDFRGIQLLNQGFSEGDYSKLQRGLSLLEEAVKYDRNNEIALLSLARGYIIIQQYDKARQTLGSLLEVYPDYDKALNLIAYSYISEADTRNQPGLLDQAINILGQVISINHKFTEGYYNLGLAYFLKGEDNRALDFLNTAIQNNGRHRQSYYLIAEILQRNGNEARAMEIRNYANSL